MGRGVRSADDHCVIVLLGAKVSQLVADQRYASKFSPATRAQLDLSKEVASELEGKTMDELGAVIQQVLGRDPAWIAASRAVLAGVSYSGHGISPDVLHARSAFNWASTGQFELAVDEMSRAVAAAADSRVKGWHQEQLAVYQHQLDPVRAQRTLAAAARLNPRVTKPIAGVSYQRLTATTSQAQAAADFLGERYSDGNSLLVAVSALLDDLIFDPDGTQAFEDALTAVGEHLGIAVQRPERDLGNGPDVLWASSGRFTVIECKSGSTADKIWRRDVAQLAHSVNWFEEQYDPALPRTPVLVHPVAVLGTNAVAPAGTRVVTAETAKRLRDGIGGMARALADDGRWKQPDAVES